MSQDLQALKALRPRGETESCYGALNLGVKVNYYTNQSHFLGVRHFLTCIAAASNIKHMDIATEVLWNKHATALPIQKVVFVSFNGKTLDF